MEAQFDSIRVHLLSCGIGIAFLIESPQGLYLVDAGTPGNEQRVLAKMRALGRSDLKCIWITHAHYDHYGSAAALRKLTGAPIGVHPDDTDSLAKAQSPLGTHRSYGWFYPLAQPLVNRLHPLPPTPPDFTLRDGETLARYGLDAAVLHTPGHTPGHTCLLLANGLAFAGDLIGGFPTPCLQMLLATDWSQLPGSLERLRAAHPQWIYTGHNTHLLAGDSLAQIHNGP
jgi:glyoxylase-like metal-dependent hydrolase (beta-lactamase superfamily II)